MGKRKDWKKIWLWHGVDNVQTEPRMTREALQKATLVANRPKDMLLPYKIRIFFLTSCTYDRESKTR